MSKRELRFTHDLLPKHKPSHKPTTVDVVITGRGVSLFNQLEDAGIIDRTRNVPHLGSIQVFDQELRKSRFDYIALQLHLFHLVSTHLKTKLRFSLNNKLHFYSVENKTTKYILLHDVITLLIVTYSIGHFYNTFTSSRAIVAAAAYDRTIYDKLIDASNEARFKKLVRRIVKAQDYSHIHLINSLIILDQLDSESSVAHIAKEIIFCYLKEPSVFDDDPSESQNSNLERITYAFEIFKKLRSLAFISYDLLVAKTPLSIDICDTESMIILLDELLSIYNNNTTSSILIDSIKKLLDDTLYNENATAIAHYEIAKQIEFELIDDVQKPTRDYYSDYFLNDTSALNRRYVPSFPFNRVNILKITFPHIERLRSRKLLEQLDQLPYVHTAHYDRQSGEQTILISISNHCDRSTKEYLAYRIVALTVETLGQSESIDLHDSRFLLCAKFLLYYVFDGRPVTVIPTIDPQICVTYGVQPQDSIEAIEQLLHNKWGTESQRFEASFLIQTLRLTPKETSISLPASICVLENNESSVFAEFDGLIFYPYREQHQIIFLEAKNTKQSRREAKNALRDRLKKLGVQFKSRKINTTGKSARLSYTIDYVQK